MSKKSLPDWNKIYRQEAPKLIATARRYLSNSDLAEDLVQESMIVAINKYDSYNGTGELGAWLRRITINQSLQYLRQNNQMVKGDDYELTALSDEDDELTEMEWTMDELLLAIDSLPNHHKAVFNMYALDGYKHKEIAEQLQITENTSKSHLNRARTSLKIKLDAMAKEKENKKRRLAGALFFITDKSHRIDSLFKKGLENHSIMPKKPFIPTDAASQLAATAGNGLAVSTKLWIAGAVVATGVSAYMLSSNAESEPNHIEEQLSSISHEEHSATTPTDSINYIEAAAQISQQAPLDLLANTDTELISEKKSSSSATISEKRIIEAENNSLIKKEEEMGFLKNISTVIIASSMAISPTLAQPGVGYSSAKKRPAPTKSAVSEKKMAERDATPESEIEPAKYKSATQFSFFYPIGSAGAESKDTEAKFSFNALVGMTHTIKGFELAGIGNINKGHVEGFQLGGIFNKTAGHMQGVQIGGIANMDGEYVRGFQLGGIANIAQADVKGLQLAGITNYAKEDLNGAQVSGILNIAKKQNGFQLALVNFADTITDDAASLGLINIFKHGGYQEFEVMSADYLTAGLSYKLGSRRLYTIYTAGYNTVDSNDQIVAGVGLGSIFYISEKVWFQPEAYYYSYAEDFDKLYGDEAIQSARLELGFKYMLNKHWGINLAPSIATNFDYSKTGASTSHFDALDTWENSSNSASLYLGISGGISFSW